MIRVVSPVVPAAIAALFATSARAQSTEHVTLRGDHAAVYNLAGHLKVEGGTGSEVTVDITRGGADATKLRVEHGTIAGDDALRVIYPAGDVVYPALGRFSSTSLHVNTDGTFGNGQGSRLGRDQTKIKGSGSGTTAFADLRVSVPRGAHVKLSLGAGDVTISNVDGQLMANVSTGPVSADHIRGDLTVETGSGAVTLADVQGNVKLETGSGGLSLTRVKGDRVAVETGSGSVTGADLNARTLTASTGSGSFRFTGITASAFKVETGSGSANIEMVSAADSIKVDSGSGGVTLTLPASIGAMVNVETGSGSIQSDFTLQSERRERGTLRGKIGDGRGQIRIDTGSGGVRILKKS